MGGRASRQARYTAWTALCLGIAAAVAGWCGPSLSFGQGADPESGFVNPTPMPYEMPPKLQEAPNTTVAPANKPLTEEELKRAEALLPLLDSKQEYWAMGEFVHLGPPVIPVLVKGLGMAAPRIRYNSIETLIILKDPSPVPALIELAKQPEEMSRVREHALRAAVRLDPALTPPLLDVLAKDPNESVRKAAAFEARYVRAKAVVPTLIGLLSDSERFVALTAVQSLWLLTRHSTDMHDWEASSKEQRVEWAQEWIDWWQSVKDTYELPPPKSPRKPLS